MKIDIRDIIRAFSILAIFLALLIYSFRHFGISSEESSQPAEELSTNTTPGRWRAANNAFKSNFENLVKDLSSLPYLQGYHKAPLKQGVTIYDSNLAYDGLNFYCSGHAPEAGIMDMKGNILHRWTYNFEDIPTKNQYEPSQMTACTHWRRVHLYENGDILAIHDSIMMIKLDKDSNLLAFVDGGLHHHMHVMENGDIYALLRRKKKIPSVSKYGKVIEDLIVCINPNWEISEKYSLLDSFKNSSYAYILKKIPAENELFHTNTIQVFDGELAHISPLYKKGNALIAVLFLNTIAIVDLEKNKVVWAIEGQENDLWSGMHEPVLLKNGNILIFDNNSRDPGIKSQSKVIEFNPFTKEIVWQYKGDKQHPFYSRTCGTNQRLPNGNTLITESDNGRAFEVTKDGKIVWEYVTPHRAGENNELIATLLHVDRIEWDSVKWLTLEQQK